MQRPHPRSIVALFVAFACLGPIACSDDEGEPVGSLAVEPAAGTLPYGTFHEVDFLWTPSAELSGAQGEPLVFVHLIDEEGRLLRTFDHPLDRDWRPGETITYPVRLYQSILAPPLPPGTYRLSAGLYDQAGERWPLAAPGERVGRKEYAVATIQVPEERGAFPSVGFSASWSATIAGGDRQVLAVRWLSEEGSIRLDDVDEPGRLWVELFIPRQDVEGTERIFVGASGSAGDGEDGAERVPRVRVTTTCSGFEAGLEGEGRHQIEVPVAVEGACEIRFAPNFYMTAGDLDRRSVLLQNIAWNGVQG